MSRPTTWTPAGMLMLALLTMLALALLAAPRPAPGGVFGQPGPGTSASAPQSVYATGR